MKVWLLQRSEPLPSDEGNNRLLRTGILANILSSQGHEVIWWSSTFNHVSKKHRFKTEKKLIIKQFLTIILLHAMGYKKNISFSRILNHRGIAKKFKLFSTKEVKPDIIVSSLPILELSEEAIKYGKQNNIPVIIDIRDLWPDIFLELFPDRLKYIAKFLLFFQFKKIARILSQATAIMGNAPDFVSWGLKYAQRDAHKFDRYFPFGYLSDSPSAKEIKESESFWEKWGITNNSKEMFICFFGNMGRYFEIDLIIEAAKECILKNIKVKFIFCGVGNNLQKYQELSNNLSNVIFPGWISAPQIWVLMRLSSMGLAPYKSDIGGFTKNLPNKAVEYLSAGLPILSSLDGYLKSLLDEHDCGITYINGDLNSLVSILQDITNNPHKLQEMSKNAIDLFEKHFRAEKVYGDMVNYLNEIVSLHKSSKLQEHLLPID